MRSPHKKLKRDDESHHRCVTKVKIKMEEFLNHSDLTMLFWRADKQFDFESEEISHSVSEIYECLDYNGFIEGENMNIDKDN